MCFPKVYFVLRLPEAYAFGINTMYCVFVDSSWIYTFDVNIELYVNAKLNANHLQMPTTCGKTGNNQTIPKAACYQYHLGKIYQS